MAGSWGESFGLSFGASFGGEGSPPAPANDRGGDGFDVRPVRNRRKYRHIVAKQLQALLEGKEEQPPAPTHKRVRKLKQEIVRNIEAGGLLGPARPQVARFVQEQVEQLYVPEMDWGALARAVQQIMQKAAEEAARIEQELEDEDFILLMVA